VSDSFVSRRTFTADQLTLIAFSASFFFPTFLPIFFSIFLSVFLLHFEFQCRDLTGAISFLVKLLFPAFLSATSFRYFVLLLLVVISSCRFLSTLSLASSHPSDPNFLFLQSQQHTARTLPHKNKNVQHRNELYLKKVKICFKAIFCFADVGNQILVRLCQK
jgi:cell division protein FtsW (lipid II flippase)